MPEKQSASLGYAQCATPDLVAWVIAPGGTTPAGAVTLVGQTQDEAEANAQQWADRLNEDPRLLRA